MTIEDSNGATATTVNPNPSVVNAPAWTEWRIPLSRFTGVDLGRIRNVTIGIGGRETPIIPGKGRISIDDVRLTRQATGSVFGIYLVETGELVLSDQDMAAYLGATHEIVLNESGIEKWNSYVIFNDAHDPPIPGGGRLYQKEFAVRIDNREIYRGRFWSGLSSLSYEGVVILDAALPCDSTRNTIRIENGYPGPAPGMSDPRADAQLLDFLAALGLLQ
jgi:hypothetical protein